MTSQGNHSSRTVPELDAVVVMSTPKVVEFIPTLNIFVVMVDILISDAVIT